MPSSNTQTHKASSQRTLLQNWALACLMTGATAVCARFAVNIPPTPVPVTLQVFAVLLAGLLLGRRWSAVAQLQYLVVGAVGVPAFAGGGHGIGTLLGLTGGYLLSYPIAAAIVGWIAGRPGDARATLPRQLLACAAGLAVIYGMGCIWYAASVHASLLAVVLPGALIFLGWDCVKAAAAIAVAQGIAAGKTRVGR